MCRYMYTDIQIYRYIIHIHKFKYLPNYSLIIYIHLYIFEFMYICTYFIYTDI